MFATKLMVVVTRSNHTMCMHVSLHKTQQFLSGVELDDAICTHPGHYEDS
jgi:hypothetical protein